MDDLTKKKCLPCEGGVIPFDISKIHKYQKKVDGWDIIKGDEDIHYLFKKFMFENNIPTGAANFFSESKLAKNYLQTVEFPIVLKAEIHSCF